MLAIINLFYLLLFCIFIAGSLIVIFHFIRYSYNKAMTALMLTIFVAAMGMLIFTNMALFSAIDFKRLFSNFN